MTRLICVRLLFKPKITVYYANDMIKQQIKAVMPSDDRDDQNQLEKEQPGDNFNCYSMAGYLTRLLDNQQCPYNTIK